MLCAAAVPAHDWRLPIGEAHSALHAHASLPEAPGNLNDFNSISISTSTSTSNQPCSQPTPKDKTQKRQAPGQAPKMSREADNLTPRVFFIRHGKAAPFPRT